MTTSVSACPICSSLTSAVADGYPGYQDGSSYQIRECEYCDLQYALPMTIPPGLYDSIYRNANYLPGYGRYLRYHDLVRSQPNPLDWLASQEPAFWFIRSELKAIPTTARILEVGSGLGYLTFAIHKAGYNITGIDISDDAVTKARSSFGDLYLHQDLAVLAAKEPSTFDVVIMTEVIEHVPNPADLLRSVASILKAGGVAFITTPNKSDFRIGAFWQSESPPVHFWWFSETAIRRLAQKSRFSIRLGDFRPMYRILPNRTLAVATVPARPSFLNAGGEVTDTAKRLQAARKGLQSKLLILRRYFGGIWSLLKVFRRIQFSYDAILQRSSSMGVVLTKRSESMERSLADRSLV